MEGVTVDGHHSEYRVTFGKRVHYDINMVAYSMTIFLVSLVNLDEIVEHRYVCINKRS